MPPRALSLLPLGLLAGAATGAAASSPVPAAPSPAPPCHEIEIGLVFDERPGETRWEVAKGRRNSVEHPSSAKVLVASPFYDPDQGYAEASETHVVCLEEGRYTFAIADDGGDGMCCDNGEGRYAVTYQETGELIATGASFELYESVTFKIPFETPPLADEDRDGRDDRTKNHIPHVLLTPAGALPEHCEPERWETTFKLHLETDDYGVETTWELREKSETGELDGRIVADGGPYASDHVYDVMYCLPPGNYTFIFYDWQCDGLTGNALTGYYSLALEGKEVYRGGTTMDQYWEEVDLDVHHPELPGRAEPRPARAVGMDAAAAPVATEARLTFTENAGGARGGWGPALLALVAVAGALGWN